MRFVVTWQIDGRTYALTLEAPSSLTALALCVRQAGLERWDEAEARLVSPGDVPPAADPPPKP